MRRMLLALLAPFVFAVPAQAMPDNAGLPKPYCLYKSVDPTLADGEVYPFRCDVNGKLETTGSGGGGGGDATAANQVTGNASLSSIDAKTPASPATSGKQDTGNTSLSTIATNTTGAATAANQASANTKLDTLHTDLVTLDGRVDGLEALLARPSTGTQSNVSGSASAVTVLAANASRLSAEVYNDSTANLYLILSSTTPSTTVFTVKILPGAYYEVPSQYTGIIKGIWDSATGAARVTELT